MACSIQHAYIETEINQRYLVMCVSCCNAKPMGSLRGVSDERERDREREMKREKERERENVCKFMLA